MTRKSFANLVYEIIVNTYEIHLRIYRNTHWYLPTTTIISISWVSTDKERSDLSHVPITNLTRELLIDLNRYLSSPKKSFFFLNQKYKVDIFFNIFFQPLTTFFCIYNKYSIEDLFLLWWHFVWLHQSYASSNN
jgi:hypothetical protein